MISGFQAGLQSGCCFAGMASHAKKQKQRVRASLKAPQGKVRRARLKARICVVKFLIKTTAINCEICLAATHFKSCRARLDLIRASLSTVISHCVVGP